MATHRIHICRIIRKDCGGDICIDELLFFKDSTCTQSPAPADGGPLEPLGCVNKPASATGTRLVSLDGGNEPQCAYGDRSPADSGVNPSWACSDFVFGRFFGFPCLPSFSTPKGEGSKPSALNASASRGCAACSFLWASRNLSALSPSE